MVRLAGAVIRQAMLDATGTGKPASNARAWLAGDSPMLTHWLECVGIEPHGLRLWLDAGCPVPSSSKPVVPVLTADDEAA